MSDTYLTFIRNNIVVLVQTFIILCTITIFTIFRTPTVELSKRDESKLHELDEKMKSLISEQIQLDENLRIFNSEISLIQDSILKLKQQREIIQNYYDEKDIFISRFDDKQLDSFFTNRYGYSQSNVLSGVSDEDNSK